jgi:succinate dehydrogenase / fumarate reductase, iron-sulfur subunit
MEKKINVKVRRSTLGSENVRMDSYEVPWEEKMSVFNVLEYIGNTLDPSLAFYASCRIGKCMGCTLRINGKRGLACTTMVESDLVLEPDDRYPVIRDLVVDMGNF